MSHEAIKLVIAMLPKTEREKAAEALDNILKLKAQHDERRQDMIESIRSVHGPHWAAVAEFTSDQTQNVTMILSVIEMTTPKPVGQAVAAMLATMVHQSVSSLAACVRVAECLPTSGDERLTAASVVAKAIANAPSNEDKFLATTKVLTDNDIEARLALVPLEAELSKIISSNMGK